jgi:hypothetical protein
MITRREFIVGIGSLSIFGIGAKISECVALPLPQEPTCLVLSPPQYNRSLNPYVPDVKISLFLLGTGAVGEILCKDVFVKYSKCSPEKDYLIKYASSKDIFENSNENFFLIYIAGSGNDKNFWKMRDFAASTSPLLLISYVFGRHNHNMLPLPFECQFCVSDDSESRKTALDVMHSVLDCIGRPGLVGLDLKDVTSTLAGKSGYGFSFRSSATSSLEAFKLSLKKHQYKLLVSG